MLILLKKLNFEMDLSENSVRIYKLYIIFRHSVILTASEAYNFDLDGPVNDMRYIIVSWSTNGYIKTLVGIHVVHIYIYIYIKSFCSGRQPQRERK